MKRLLFSYLLLFFCQFSHSQGEGSLSIDKSFDSRQWSLAFLLNTNGWGGSFSYVKQLDGYSKRIYTVDYVGMKHPKEVKSTHLYNDNQSRFVYGKLNAFSNLRLGIGNQKELFGRFDKGGISIEYFYSAGLNLAFVRPVYYEVIYPTSIYNVFEYRVEKYDFTSVHQRGDIYGKASVLEGVDEISVIPGGFFKTGVVFDYSEQKKVVRSVEAGLVVDIFYKKPLIMAIEQNSQLFLTLFVSVRFGKSFSRRLKKMSD